MSVRPSYLDLFDIDLHKPNENIAVGDIVATGTNSYPRFEVLALHGHKAWVVDTANPHVYGTPNADQCRVLERPGLRLAA